MAKGHEKQRPHELFIPTFTMYQIRSAQSAVVAHCRSEPELVLEMLGIHPGKPIELPLATE